MRVILGKSLAFVAVGSALGGVARVALSAIIARWHCGGFPWGTFAVNVSGCFLIGVFWSWAEVRMRLSPGAQYVLMAGFCGGFTTFSSLAMESAGLIRSGFTPLALVYMGASGLFGLAAFWAGSVVGSTFHLI